MSLNAKQQEERVKLSGDGLPRRRSRNARPAYRQCSLSLLFFLSVSSAYPKIRPRVLAALALDFHCANPSPVETRWDKAREAFDLKDRRSCWRDAIRETQLRVPDAVCATTVSNRRAIVLTIVKDKFNNSRGGLLYDVPVD
ncbi:hypothetical protein HN011_003891 [Eciton burchellii]|nr:hypothetical protein HN011_003891 [Eciton burchellii]